MDPHHQQTLLNEVLYLHSLYHHGPPPATPSPPSSQQRPVKLSGWPEQTPFQNHLHLTNHTHFKKPISKKPKKTQRHHFSGKEWPVKPPVDQSPATLSGWPELKLKPKLQKPTKQEMEICNWNQTQVKAVEKVKEFYKLNKNDSDDDDVSNDSMDDDDDDVSSEDECDDDDKEDGFYWELFNGDEDLKEKYVKGCFGGVCEFTCLVCGGVSEKYGKRFKDCVGLVQHAVTVKKTKRRRGHRVFGKVVCRVLGWDIDRLPSSSVAECKNSELQVTDNNAEKDLNTASSSTLINQIMDSGNSNREADDVSKVVDCESMVCENVAVITNVEEENKTKQVLNEAVGNCQQSLQELVINNGAGSSTSKKVDDKE